MRLLILAVFGVAAGIAADNITDSAQPLVVYRGDTVTVTGTNFVVGAPFLVTLTRCAQRPCGADEKKSDAKVTGFPTNETTLTFVVPRGLAFGKWQFLVDTPAAAPAAGGAAAGAAAGAAPPAKAATVTSTRGIDVKAKAPHIDSVSPKVVYLASPVASVTVIGSGFTEDKDEYRLNFLDAHSPPHCGEGVTTHCYNTATSVEGRQLTFSWNSADTSELGKRSFNIVVDDAASNPMDITISKVDESTPRVWAIGLVAILVLVVYLLLRAGKKNIEHTVMGDGDDRTYFLSALFLDKETNTYSLSQCQFYVWTLAGLLGYIYLATSKSLIQGSPAFPDIPTGLPGILLASAGTTVLAAGITSAKGGKGSGEIHPSLSDFITSGGVVAAERLQFVVWTLVGVVTFVRLVFLSDPATIDTLPEIPSNFLQLMGISSAGYLGGKLVRKAGPNIVSVTANSAASVLCLEVNGQGLSPSGAFSIDEELVAPEQISGTDAVKVLQKDDASGDAGFAKKLSVSIANPKAAWLTADQHKVTISNPDGQKAVGSFKVTALGPFAVTLATLSLADGRLTVTGSGLTNATVGLTTDAAGKTLAFTADAASNLADDKIVGAVVGAEKDMKITVTVTPVCGAPVTTAVTLS